jgi:MATE family multidrug resistance protein
MSVMDTIMSGHAGTVDLAGVAIGASIWFPGFLLSGGMLAALTPVIAGMTGQSSPFPAMRHVVHQAMWISVFLTIGFVFLGVFGLDRVLDLMHLETDVRRIARHYLVALSWGFLPLFVTAVLQNFFDAVGFARWTMCVVLCALPVNAVLNMGLIFGLWEVFLSVCLVREHGGRESTLSESQMPWLAVLMSCW